jgi:16S rRNA (cytosine967-C5)-methyltransferase
MSARSVAFRTLLRVFEEGAYADRAFRAEAEVLDGRDRALAMQLAYGSVQRVRTLDHAVEAIGRRPVPRLDPPVRAALRLGTYQLGYLDAIPAHAAVNETVELVRAARLERAVPFTNAVMRRLVVQLRPLLAGLRDETPQAAALAHSYPDWIGDVWWRDLGADEARAVMRAQNDPPPTVVRVNALRPGPLPRGAPLTVAAVPPEWLEQGLVWPQSAASQLAAETVGARPGERVLDLCGAPGGKATQLAVTAAEVVAVEKHPGRARELERNAARLGATNVRVVVADALELPEELTGFDRVLVDAPCSGLGILAFRPDLRWRSEPLPDLQVALLRVALERVRTGGTVSYSVCTINRDENEAVVGAVGAPLDDLGADWPAFRHPQLPQALLTLPHVHATAGFFVARLRP